MINRRFIVIGLFLMFLVGPISAAESFRWSRDIGARPIHISMSQDQQQLYVSSGFPEGDAYVLSPSGETKRVKSVQGSYEGEFTVGSTGEVYYTKNTNAGVEWTVFGWGADFSERWQFKDHTVFKHGVALSADDHLYIGGENGKFYSITDGGSLRWSRQWDERLIGASVIGPDGVIYQTSYSGQLRAVTSGGTVKWSVSPDGSRLSNLSIGSDGVIYLGTERGGLFAIGPGGTIRWHHDVGSSALRTDPVVGERGQIYFTTADNRLISISPSGEKQWGRELPGDPSQYLIRNTPAVDRDGRIYVGNFRDNRDGYFCIYSPSGELIRQRHLAGVRGNMLLSPSGDLYFVTGQRIHSLETASDSEVRYSPWPMYQQDYRNTGRAPGEKSRRGSPVRSMVKPSPSGPIEGTIHVQNNRIVPEQDVVAVHLKSLDGGSVRDVDPSTVALAGIESDYHWVRDRSLVFVFTGRGLAKSAHHESGAGSGWRTKEVTLEGQLKNGRRFQASSHVEVWSGGE